MAKVMWDAAYPGNTWGFLHWLAVVAAEEHGTLWRRFRHGDATGELVHATRFFQDALYTLLAGLKIMLLVSVRPSNQENPRCLQLWAESLAMDPLESSSLDIFRGDNVWYISRLEGGDCFLQWKNLRSHILTVSGTSLDERGKGRNSVSAFLREPAPIPVDPNQSDFHSLSCRSAFEQN